jgi:hypothetical protein
MLDLRAIDEPIPDLDGVALAPDERRHAIHEWRGRMVSEHCSARVFAALLAPMMRAGIDASRQAAVATMVADELRHARLCASLVTALGGDARAPLPAELPDVPAHEDAGPLEALLRNLLAISCLEETAAVAVLEGVRHRATAAPVAAIVRSILADEVAHARLGWSLLDEMHPLAGALCDRLGAYLVPAFRQLFARFLVPSAHASLAGSSVGACDPEQDRAVFLRTVAEVIVPGLEAFGLAAATAVEVVAREQRPAT